MLSFFPLDVLDEIWDVIESVSEGFLTYSFILGVLTHFFIEWKILSFKSRGKFIVVFFSQKIFCVCCYFVIHAVTLWISTFTTQGQ